MSVKSVNPDLPPRKRDSNDDEPVSAQGASPGEVGVDPDATAGLPAEIPEEALREAREEAALYRDRWTRTSADLENFKKWTHRDREEWTARRTAELFEELLKVRDDFERALAHAPQGPDDAVLAGMRLVYRHLVDFFERFGAKPIEAQGKPFDPELHEAILQVPRDDVAPGTVVDVALPGYRLGEKVLRHAQVVVSCAGGGSSGDRVKNG